MRCLVVVAIASGCSGGGGTDGGGGWVFTATVTAALNQASGDVDLAPGASVGSTDTMFSISGKDAGAPCEHAIGIYVAAPLAVQSYQLGAMTGSASDSFAVYTDCRLGGYYLHTDGRYTGTITVTRADASCAQPPCIDATFGFSVPEPVSPTTTFADQINNGHVSNY